MPWLRVHHMQRNSLGFDSATELQAALESPVRQEMRADAGRFPAFSGGTLHYAMLAEIIAPWAGT